MKIEDVKVGMEVRFKGAPYKGVIKSLPDYNGEVSIDWGWKTDVLDEEDVDELEAVDPVADQILAKSIQDKINKVKSELEKAFEVLAEIKTARNDHFHIFSEHLVSIDELENVIEEGGWRSSSLWC